MERQAFATWYLGIEVDETGNFWQRRRIDVDAWKMKFIEIIKYNEEENSTLV